MDEEEGMDRDADSGEVRADGGTDSFETETNPFTIVSDSEAEVTRQDQIIFWVESQILAPFRVLWADWRGRAGFSILVLYVFIGTIGTQLVPKTQPFAAPLELRVFHSIRYPLGTTPDGEDIFSLIVHATPTMFEIIVGGAVTATVFGIIYGIFSGYQGGTIDQSLMAVADLVIAIPGLPLIIVLSAYFEPSSPVTVGLLLAVNRWAGLARRIRSQILSVRQKSYVEASRTMGISMQRVLLKNVLPNIMPYATMNFVQSARGIIIASVGLYFLGILPFTNANWGVIMNRAYNSGALTIPSLIHWLIAPMVAIVFLSLGLILLGQSADSIFNPRLRARHESTVIDEE